jgi:hypothetical protein
VGIILTLFIAQFSICVKYVILLLHLTRKGKSNRMTW